MNQQLTLANVSTRQIVHRTMGNRHGPITRLISPSDLGNLIKPFVFLDYFEAEPGMASGSGWHPHSGIATITFVLSGTTSYEDSTGKQGLLPSGGIEWMRAVVFGTRAAWRIAPHSCKASNFGLLFPLSKSWRLRKAYISFPKKSR